MENRENFKRDYYSYKEVINDDPLVKEGVLACEKFEENCKSVIKNVKRHEKKVKSDNSTLKFDNVTLAEWITIILKVSPYVGALCEYIDGDIKKLSSFSYSGYRTGKTAYSLCNDMIDMIDRKVELVNLSYVASVILGNFGEEYKDIIDTTITNSMKISEIAQKGHYKWVYTKRDKFLLKATEFCKSLDWNRKFMIEHFSREPIVRYYFALGEIK